MSTPLAAGSPDLQRQRQAVYTGLISVLTADQANAALESWSIYFGETGSVFNGLNAFARDVCASFDKTGQQRDLVKALNRALLSMDSGDRAPPASKPAALAASPLATGKAAGSTLTSELQTFHYLMAELLLQLEKSRSGLKPQALDFLNEVILSMPWSEAQQQQMASLLATGSTVQTRGYRNDQLQALLKHFRSWMADEIGIKATEQLLKQALQHTEASVVSSKHAPGSFI